MHKLDERVNQLLAVSVRRMRESMDTAERAIQSEVAVDRITGVLHSLVWGMANTYSQIETAINWIEDERKVQRYVLKQIMESLPSNIDWLDPEIERLARDILKEETQCEKQTK